MLHRIREAMTDAGFPLGENGPVEIDETFVGGKAKNMHASRRAKLYNKPETTKGKTVVVGMLERGGKVKATVVAERNKETLLAIAHAEIASGSTVITDELHAYRGMNHTHEVVNHALEYVRGHIHTNGIESFWAMLKRGLAGTYISVEPFHLDAYVAEQVFRYNTRKDFNDATRFEQCMSQIQGKRLTYAELTSRERLN
jgi:transposase-like protein